MNIVIINALGNYAIQRCINSLYATTPDNRFDLYVFRETGFREQTLNKALKTVGTEDILILGDDILLTQGWFETLMTYYSEADILGMSMLYPDTTKIHNRGYDLVQIDNQVTVEAADRGKDKREVSQFGFRLADALCGCFVFAKSDILKKVHEFSEEGQNRFGEFIFFCQAREQGAKMNRVLVEQFIGGTHHDVNGLFWDGKFYGCGVMDRHFSSVPYCVPITGYDPSTLSFRVKEKLYTFLEKAVRSLGISCGPVKGDFIISRDGEIYILEVSARFHGDVFTSFTRPRSMKVSPIKTYMKALYENKFSPEDLNCSDNLLSAWQVLKLPAGRIKEISGLQEAEQVAGIDRVIFRVNEGDKIKDMQNNSDVPGFVWASGGSRDEIDNSYETFYENFHVEYYSN